MNLSRHRLHRSALLMAAASLAFGGAVLAAELPAGLTGVQEVPPVMTKATGHHDIVVRDDKSVTGGIDVKDLDSTTAHIHVGAPGVSGPPIVTLAKASATRWIVPPGTTLTDMQFKSYKAGDLYVNVHSAAHPAGEIRTQLKP